jgi:EamA-like transporter family.
MTITALRLTITATITLFIIISNSQYELITEMSFTNWSYIILIVISSGSIALFIYYYGLNHLPASHVTIYELFWPLSAVTIDWFIYERVMTAYQFIGAIILLTSIILLSNENTTD